jgi:hypothetical protein
MSSNTFLAVKLLRIFEQARNVANLEEAQTQETSGGNDGLFATKRAKSFQAGPFTLLQLYIALRTVGTAQR